MGAAYLFVDPAFEGGAGWADEAPAATLTPSDKLADEKFGWSVSISTSTSPNSEIPSGYTVVVGAPNDTAYGNSDQGAAYVFAGPTASQLVRSEYTSSDGVAGDYFGTSVALSGNTMAVGAVEAAGGAASRVGTAYIFATGAATLVSTTKATGTYGAGTTIPIQVSFNDNVTVTGTPQLALNAGNGAVAAYSSGSGTSTLTFMYTVGTNQASPDLDYASTTALQLNGGTIVDALTGVAATLTLPAPGTIDGLSAKNIVIDPPPAHGSANPLPPPYPNVVIHK